MRFSDISSRCRAFPGFRQDLRQGEEKAQSLKLGTELGFWLRKQDLNPRPSGYTLSLIICTCSTIYKYYSSRLQGLLTSSCITMYHHVSPCLCIIHFHTYDYTYVFRAPAGSGIRRPHRTHPFDIPREPLDPLHFHSGEQACRRLSPDGDRTKAVPFMAFSPLDVPISLFPVARLDRNGLDFKI